MFHVYCFLLFCYVLIRLILPLQIYWTYRTVIALALLMGAMNRYVCQLLFGDMFSPELPGAVVLGAGALMGTVLFAAAIGLAADAAAVIILAARGKAHASQWLRSARFVALAAGLLLACTAAYNGQKPAAVNEVDVTIQDLPPELDGLRIVQLSDLHVSRLLGKNWLHDVVVRANALNPDAMVITGDLIGGYVPVRDTDVSPLSGLRARQGVFVALGNHEYYFDPVAWTAKFRAQGMHVLINEHTAIERGGRRLIIAATSDEAAEKFGGEMPDPAKALRGVGADQPIVLLRHRPNGIYDSGRLGVDLQLAGHTHGGMIWGVDRVIANANDGMVSGMYQRGTTQVYVNNGTGVWNGFPLRLGRPAEITVFTLVSGRSNTSET